MTKTIKVQYSTRYTDRRYSEVPKIQMEGKWLEAIGFSVGDKLLVDYDDGKIVIRTVKETTNAFLIMVPSVDRKRLSSSRIPLTVSNRLLIRFFLPRYLQALVYLPILEVFSSTPLYPVIVAGIVTPS